MTPENPSAQNQIESSEKLRLAENPETDLQQKVETKTTNTLNNIQEKQNRINELNKINIEPQNASKITDSKPDKTPDRFRNLRKESEVIAIITNQDFQKTLENANRNQLRLAYQQIIDGNKVSIPIFIPDIRATLEGATGEFDQVAQNVKEMLSQLDVKVDINLGVMEGNLKMSVVNQTAELMLKPSTYVSLYAKAGRKEQFGKITVENFLPDNALKIDTGVIRNDEQVFAGVTLIGEF